MYIFVKRVFDIVFSLIGLIFLLPLFFIVAIVIKLDSRGPVFYSQTRIGKQRVPFTLYKFRSMVVGAEERLKDLQDQNKRYGPAFKIHNDPRVTRFGRFIRRTCIDELPQLLNILKGEMSFVGPRPPLPEEVKRYNAYQKKRLEIKPGLTCYWQISNRDMTFNKWVMLDIMYIQKKSIIEDVIIILKTFTVVFVHLGDR